MKMYDIFMKMSMGKKIPIIRIGLMMVIPGAISIPCVRWNQQAKLYSVYNGTPNSLAFRILGAAWGGSFPKNGRISGFCQAG
jgi:hypothetical protein